ncbi:NAD(P)/FAD-dependent oxidoreductase [Sciscionella marina]|uniref:NAD(P)/FAD-dependent oxidoreductase n=1 Tax=Sciscionella marina TaxID=508770 RepID=UPI0009FDB111|nr:FAD-dependent oxidoreductase [Sciscionella marina]
MSRIVVIGAGMVGTAVAHALTTRGAEVVVLDRGEPGHGTSRTTFAMDITARKTPRAYFDLSLQAAHRHTELAEQLTGDGRPSWLHHAPSIEIGVNEHDRTVMTERRDRLAEWGYPGEFVETSDLGELAAGLDLSRAADTTAVVYPGAAWYDPATFIARVFESIHAELHPHTEVTALHRRGEHGWTVHTRTHTWEADTIVNCAGPDAARIAALAGTDLALEQVPGIIGYTGPLPQPHTHAVLTLWDINLRPTPEQGLCLHSYPVDATLQGSATNGNTPPETLKTDLAARAAEIVPALRHTPTTNLDIRIGIRPVPTDGLPLIGEHHDSPGLYTLATHSAIHLAPILAEHAAGEILSQAPVPALEPYRPDRPTAPAMDESLNEMTRTYQTTNTTPTEVST